MAEKIDKALAALTRVFDKRKVVKASEYLREVPRIQTGVFGIDLATGGGIPLGKISLIAGNESSCKSAICYNLIANAQKRGGLAALIDIEQGLTPSWAKVFGIDMDSLILAYPETLEEAFNVADGIVHMAKPAILVVDAISACSPEEEREKQFDEGERRAERAKLVNRFMRVMGSNLKPYEDESGKVRPSDTAVVCINHLYHDPSSQYFSEYMPGGRGQLFWSSLTIYMKRRRWVVEEIITEDEEGGEDLKDERTVGLTTQWKIEKSKVSPAQRTGEFTFFTENTLDGEYYQGQIQETDHLIHIGRMWNIISKKGAWYYMRLGDNEYKAHGASQMTSFFEEHGDEFVAAVLQKMDEESKAARDKPNRPMLPPEGEGNGSLDPEPEDSTENG